MQFLLLIYENEQRFASGFDPAEMQEYDAFGKQHASAIKGGNALHPTTEGQTVRVRNGKALTTDLDAQPLGHVEGSVEPDRVADHTGL